MKGLALTIYDVTELNRTKKFIDIAKEDAPVGREKLRDALKLAGATFDQQTKRWNIEKEHPNAGKRVLDFVDSKRLKGDTGKKQAEKREPLRVDPVTGQSQLDDTFFAIETKPVRIQRKKVSIDLDVGLHKRLKQMAIEHDMKLYELVEGVLRDFVEKRK